MWNWRKMRVLNDWVIVKDDPRQTTSKGGIILPDKELLAERVSEGTGTLLAVGPGVAKKLGVTLEPGERICFRGFLKDVFHEFEPEEGCTVFMLRAADILMVIPKDLQMGFAS